MNPGDLTPEYVKAIEDWLKWYNEHAAQTEGRGLEQRIAFLEKGLRGSFIILAGLTQELARIGERKDAERRLLHLPVSWRR